MKISNLSRPRLYGRVVLIAVSAILCAIPDTARAAPYDLIAVYTAADKEDELTVVSVGEQEFLPLTASKHSLVHIALRFHDDAISRVERAWHRDYVAIAHCGRGRQRKRIGPITIKAKTITSGNLIIPVLTADKLWDCSPSSAYIQLEVRTKPTADFLCAAERSLRFKGQRQEPRCKSLCAAKPDAGESRASESRGAQAGPGSFRAAVDLPPLVHESGGEILWSFCPEIRRAVDWERTDQRRLEDSDCAACLRLGLSRTEVANQSIRDIHRRAMQEMVLANAASTELEGALRMGPDIPGGSEEMYIATRHSLHIVNALTHQMSFYERDRDGIRGLATVMAHDSEVGVRLDGALCDAIDCNVLLSRAQVLVERHVDGKTTTDEITLSLPHDCDVPARSMTCRPFKFPADKYIGESLLWRLVLRYKSADGPLPADADDPEGERTVDIEILRADVVPRNLGLVMSFPVVSEVISALQNVDPANPSASSTIPISWAFPLSSGDGTGAYAAITFPWMISYNPRQTPRLAEYVSGFAHLSVLLPATTAEGDTTTDESALLYAVGVGGSLFRTFHFSWAIDLQHGRSFVLAGISIPELVKFVKLTR